jgi:hypothetical protein
MKKLFMYLSSIRVINIIKAKRSNGHLTLKVEVVSNTLLFLFSLQKWQVHNQMRTAACEGTDFVHYI